MWGGLALAYAAPKLPASFAIMALATLEFALAALASIALRRRVRRQRRLSMPQDGDPRPTASPAQFARDA
jgi:hypothetical protein